MTNPFDSFINKSLDTDGFESFNDNAGMSANETFEQENARLTDQIDAALRRDVAYVSSDEAALDAASMFMGRPLTEAEARTVLNTLHNGGGPVELDVPEDDDDDSEDETLRIEQHAQPVLSELFSHAGDNPDIDDLFNEFMDTLPDPNSTSLWESKLDDIQLQLRGLVTNEVYQNFVDGHYSEWMPDANDFATMEAYQRARKQEIVKIKYLISFAISLMSLAEGHLRRTMGNE